MRLRVLRVRTHLSGTSTNSLVVKNTFSLDHLLLMEINEGKIISFVEGYGNQGKSKLIMELLSCLA